MGKAVRCRMIEAAVAAAAVGMMILHPLAIPCHRCRAAVGEAVEVKHQRTTTAAAAAVVVARSRRMRAAEVEVVEVRRVERQQHCT